MAERHRQVRGELTLEVKVPLLRVGKAKMRIVEEALSVRRTGRGEARVHSSAEWILSGDVDHRLVQVRPADRRRVWPYARAVLRLLHHAGLTIPEDAIRTTD